MFHWSFLGKYPMHLADKSRQKRNWDMSSQFSSTEREHWLMVIFLTTLVQSDSPITFCWSLLALWRWGWAHRTYLMLKHCAFTEYGLIPTRKFYVLLHCEQNLNMPLLEKKSWISFYFQIHIFVKLYSANN